MIPDVLATVSPYAWGLAGLLIVVLALAVALVRTRQRGERPEREHHTSPEDRLTLLAAGIATIVAGQGMWQFLARAISDVPWTLRALMFAFIEVAVVTSAVRARRNMREKFSAGADGLAVWALTGTSAILSSLEARSLPEVLFRLAAPLIAAWLWERGMAVERRRIRGTSGIHWRVTPERVLVRLGLAEASDRTASDVDAQRRIARIALAAKRARVLEQAGARKGRQRRALAALDRAVDRAVEHASLATDPARMWQMLDQITAMYAAGDLRYLPATAPWSALHHPAILAAATGTSSGIPDRGDDGPDDSDVPEGPADLAARTLPLGPVPDPLYPVAASRYADELADGRVPGVKRIKSDLRIGQPRADRVQGYLQDLARILPPPPRSDAPQAPEVTFREPPTLEPITAVNGSPIPAGDAG